jgi:hypothetical protein
MVSEILFIFGLIGIHMKQVDLSFHLSLAPQTVFLALGFQLYCCTKFNKAPPFGIPQEKSFSNCPKRSKFLE